MQYRQKLVNVIFHQILVNPKAQVSVVELEAVSLYPYIIHHEIIRSLLRLPQEPC